LGRFSGPPKTSALQPAQREPFTNGAKMGHLYDSAVFPSSAQADYFPRNLLKRNKINTKTASPRCRQNRVTYNNMPSADIEKRGLFAELERILRPAGFASKQHNHADFFFCI